MANPIQTTQAGETGYLNNRCWLVKNLKSAPYRRCRHCRFRFRNCLFLHYQIISAILIAVFLSLFFFIEGTISTLVAVSIFSIVIVYGYFFNRSTEKIIEANFEQAKAKDALQELTRTLEKRVSEQTKDLKAQTVHLKKLLAMRSEFLDIASHQLKTPVSVILGATSMFRDGCMDKLPKKQQLKFIDNIFFKAKKLNVIINDILRASEMDTDEFKLEHETVKPVQIEETLKAVCDDLESLAKDKGLKLICQKPKRPVAKILSNADFLEQAVYNLVDNAIKYTAKGEVKVILSEADRRVIVKVADTGIGIPEADKKKMFDKFARAKNAVNMYTDGSGLGIFIVKKIVEAHKGGQVSFESIEGDGTVFTISFPICPAKAKSR